MTVVVSTLKVVLSPVKRFFQEHVLQVIPTWAMMADIERVPSVTPRLPVTFQPLTPEYREALTRASEHEYNETLAREIELGYPGEVHIGVSSSNEIVFSAWLLYGRIDTYSHDFIDLAPDAAYSYRVVTSVNARGAHVCAAYYGYLRAVLEPRGVHRLVCLVARYNETSVRAHRSAGFEPVGRLWQVRIGGHVLTYLPRALRRRLQSCRA
jgi:hypothetical protein